MTIVRLKMQSPPNKPRATRWMIRRLSSALVFSTLLVVLQLLHCVVECRQKVSRIVRTRQGPVQGILNTHPYLRESEAYLGIPYASPPVDNFRFMPPMSPQVRTYVIGTATTQKIRERTVPFLSNNNNST